MRDVLWGRGFKRIANPKIELRVAGSEEPRSLEEGSEVRSLIYSNKKLSSSQVLLGMNSVNS
jgi:hypothetical protein